MPQQNSVTLGQMRKSASLIMAAAVLELFPGTSLFGGNEDSLGFYYDFTFPFEFHFDLLDLIQERMREFILQEHPIQIHEMMPENAGSFLRHHGHFSRAQALSNNVSLVEIVRIKDFIDYSFGPHLNHCGELKAFALKKMSLITSKRGRIVRIWGTAFFEKSDLKHFLKCLENYKEKNHLLVGSAMNLFSLSKENNQKQYRFHPKGEILKETIINYCKKKHRQKDFQMIATPLGNCQENLWEQKIEEHISYFLSLKHPQQVVKIFECSYFVKAEEQALEEVGMFNSKQYSAALSHVFCLEKDLLDECISSLQFIIKFYKLFCLKGRWVLCSSPPEEESSSVIWKKQDALLKKAMESCGIAYEIEEMLYSKAEPEVQLKIPDGVGREWISCFLKLKDLVNHRASIKEKGLIIFSLLCSLERFIALLLEQACPLLPFWLMPEQVRVLILKPLYLEWAQGLVDEWNAQGIRATLDREELSLADRMHQALLERVPYVIVIGEKEFCSQSVSIRCYGSEAREWLSIDEWSQKLLQLKKESEIEN